MSTSGRIPGGAAIGVTGLLVLALTLGSPPDPVDAKESCGTYESTSIYERAKVVAIRGVSCSKALRVAKRFDQDSEEIDGWDCGLAHDDLPRLFSCGKGGSGSGPLQDRPNALVARGVGQPDGG